MPTFNQDNSFTQVTAILDSDGNELFETVGILGLSAASSIAYPQHTLENGVTISDHAIKLQDRLTIRAVLSPVDYVEVYRRIKNALQENTLFIIQTKVEIYSNMVIATLPHEEDRKDTVMLNLDFIEQQFQFPTVGILPLSAVANPADSDTVKGGNKQPAESDGTLLLQAGRSLGFL